MSERLRFSATKLPGLQTVDRLALHDARGWFERSYCFDTFKQAGLQKTIDVVIDMRAGSLTFLQWHAEILSTENRRSLLIPEGFAHGFQTLSDDVEMLYFHTANYAPSSAGGVNPLDPKLAINWPLPFTEVSEQDKNLPMLLPNFEGIRL